VGGGFWHREILKILGKKVEKVEERSGCVLEAELFFFFLKCHVGTKVG